MLADGLLVNEIFRLLRREEDGRTPLADGFRFWKEFLTSSQSFWEIDFVDHIVNNFVMQIVIADHCFYKICKLLLILYL